MNTTKTLMLAAFAALSLGIGTAMAQDGSDVSNDYQAAKIWSNIRHGQTSLDAGSSDRGGWQLGPFHSTPDRLYPVAGNSSGTAP